MISKEEMYKAMDVRFGKDIHDKLRNGRVAIAGLGGLGSHIAIMLARCGIENLCIIDFDKIDITNLNRQEYHVEEIGKYKTEAMKERIYHINPYINTKVFCGKVTPQNIEEIFKDYDIICEAFDKPDQKAMLINGIFETFPDKKIVAGSGLAGFDDCNKIVTKKVFKNLYMCGDGSTDVAECIGLMAPRVMVCAGHQANKVVQLLIEE